MKFASIGVAAVVTAAFVTPALAQAIIEDPGYCAEFYPNANCQNWDRATHTIVTTTGRTVMR
jgi:hypothetical protein